MKIEEFLSLSVEQLRVLQTMSLSYNNLGNLDETQIQALFARLSQCPALQTIVYQGNYFEVAQKMQFQRVVTRQQEEIEQAKIIVKTFLLCWNRLRKQEVPDISLWSLPKELVMKILGDTGYTHNAESDRPEIARKRWFLQSRGSIFIGNVEKLLTMVKKRVMV